MVPPIHSVSFAPPPERPLVAWHQGDVERAIPAAPSPSLPSPGSPGSSASHRGLLGTLFVFAGVAIASVWLTLFLILDDPAAANPLARRRTRIPLLKRRSFRMGLMVGFAAGMVLTTALVVIAALRAGGGR